MRQKSTIKFLNYWWNPNSVIDPSIATEDYFKVVYDELGQYNIVERYNRQHQLISTDKFFWEDHHISKIEVYKNNGEMEKFIVYQYAKQGIVHGRIHYHPNGELLFHETYQE